MNKEIVVKIKKLRTAKGLKQEFVADKLHIARTTYQKLESGESYAWAKYFDDLMLVFETTPQEFFSDIGLKKNKQNYLTESVINENLYRENREIYGQLIAAKDEQIALLKSLLEKE